VERPLTDLEVDPFASAAVLGVLDAADRRYLVSRSVRRSVDKGQILFLEGDRSDSVLVLISGHMNVLRYSSGGDQFIVNTVVPGDTIGEVGVLSKGPRSATVQATEPSVVLKLAGSVIIDLVSERPAMAVALLERMADMVRRITGVATDLVFLDLRQRVAKHLLQLDTVEPHLVRSDLTQGEVAARIGASRQRVNACLRDFATQGWISMESRRLRVLDRDALTQLVNF